MSKIKQGATRVIFDFRTPENAIEFWENFKDVNPEWGNVGLVMEDPLHKQGIKNSWLVRLQGRGNGRPVNYKQEFNAVYSISIGDYVPFNVEV